MSPTYQIASPTSRYTIHDRWVYRVCWVRTADGALQCWEIPESPLGGTE